MFCKIRSTHTHTHTHFREQISLSDKRIPGFLPQFLIRGEQIRSQTFKLFQAESNDLRHVLQVLQLHRKLVVLSAQETTEATQFFRNKS